MITYLIVAQNCPMMHPVLCVYPHAHAKEYQMV